MNHFKILATDLPSVTGGVGSPNPSKFIIRFLFSDFTNPEVSMKLLLYPANNHGHYGQGLKPIKIEPIPSTNSPINNNLVIGNLEIQTRQLLKSVPPGPPNSYFFDHIILTPKLISDSQDQNSHLTFAIDAYNSSGDVIRALAINDANPSPPKPPMP